MKTRLNIRNIPKGILILLLLAQFFYTSCTQDELKAPDPIEQTHELEILPAEVHLEYIKKSIDFNGFRARINEISPHSGISGRAPTDLSFILESGYVQAVDTERITEFTKDSLSTFTFNVITSDENATSFTNLIYVFANEEVSYGLIKYTPSQDWIDAKQNGENIPFQGEISIIDDLGNELGSQNVQNGSDRLPTTISSRGCSITAEPIIQECYGSACPCPDGNGLIIGWNFNISCSGWGGGGGSGGSGGGPGGGGSGGGSGGGGTGMDLPTDPVEWDLFMNIHNISGPNDYFYFDPSLDPNQCQIFNTFYEFEPYLTDVEFGLLPPIDNQDGTFTTNFRIRLGVLGMQRDINILIKQRLKDVNIPQTYFVESVLSTYTGLTLGSSWEMGSFNYTIANNIATIDLYGNLHYNMFIEDIGTVLIDSKHYQLQIDIYTGNPIAIIEIED
jgi:hypothetical protein